MRLGLVLAPAPGGDPLESLVAQAGEAEAAGIDIGWVEGDGRSVDALLTAAALAPATSTLRLAAVVAVGGHPLGIAEAAAVADNVSAGRIVLVLRATGDAGLLAETTDVILAASAPKPFRHHGERWTIPGNLPENDLPEERIIVTPTMVQTELPIWLAGDGVSVIACERGLPWVEEDDDGGGAARRWEKAEQMLGVAAARLRRVGDFAVAVSADGRVDADALVARLAAASGWGLDTAVLRLPAELSDTARSAFIAQVARRVRPRLIMHSLPAGLDDHWREVLA